MSAKEIWKELEPWYKDCGILDIETLENGREIRTWHDPVRMGDKYVKAINQVMPRFKLLFPKAKLITQYNEKSKRSIQVLSGIGFINNDSTRTNEEEIRTNAAPIPAPETTQWEAFRTTRTSSENFEENKNEKNISTTPVDDIFFNVKQEETQSTGAGTAESSHSNNSGCVTGAATGADQAPTGAGKGADQVPIGTGETHVRKIRRHWRDRLQPGEQVTYIGNKAGFKEKLEGKVLTIHSYQSGYALCSPAFNNGVNPIIPPEELERVQPEIDEFTQSYKSSNGVKLQINDNVVYCGDDARFQDLKDKQLVVAELKYNKVACKFSDGYYTTWIEPSEFQIDF